MRVARVARVAGSAMLALLLAGGSSLSAQDRGAAALAEAIEGLGVNMRVLMIGAHPDDEDTQVISWLSRGHHVETAYLSLTRGDGGQNIIGNELGEALGVVRTEELLAARRVDGGLQFFTRAYDYGYSKSAEEAFTQWPHDLLLRDVITVVRSFRPHVIISVFSGTTRDFVTNSFGGGRLYEGAFDEGGQLVFDDAWIDPGRNWQHQKTVYAFEGDNKITFALDVAKDGEAYLPHSSGVYHRQ
jgi:hypothetical protein